MSDHLDAEDRRAGRRSANSIRSLRQLVVLLRAGAILAAVLLAFNLATRTSVERTVHHSYATDRTGQAPCRDTLAGVELRDVWVPDPWVPPSGAGRDVPPAVAGVPDPTNAQGVTACQQLSASTVRLMLPAPAPFRLAIWATWSAWLAWLVLVSSAALSVYLF